MSRILFLDFDGVLHPKGVSALDENGRIIIEPLIFCWLPILEELLHPHPEVSIVVSSDWRFLATDEDLRNFLGALGCRFSGVTSETHGGGNRARQIETYVEQNLFPGDGWLALDDDLSVLDRQGENDGHFVWCPPQSGISTPEVQAKIRDWLG